MKAMMSPMGAHQLTNAWTAHDNRKYRQRLILLLLLVSIMSSQEEIRKL